MFPRIKSAGKMLVRSDAVFESAGYTSVKLACQWQLGLLRGTQNAITVAGGDCDPIPTRDR